MPSMMEVGFIKADTSNLPNIDAVMIAKFFAYNTDLFSAECRNIKTAVLIYSVSFSETILEHYWVPFFSRIQLDDGIHEESRELLKYIRLACINSGIDPSNLKLKIGGTIDLPFYSDTEQFRATPIDDGSSVNVLRMSNDTSTDGNDDGTDDESPLKPDSTNNPTSSESTTDAADYSDSEAGGPGNMTKLKEPQHAAEQNLHNPVFISVEPALRIPTTIATKKPKPQKVRDDDMIRNFSTHVYNQALKAFESMKKKADQYTQSKIDSLAETYKEKFKDFVQRTRDTPIKTSQGAQNAILNTIDTSNLIMERIVNFLKTDMHGSGTSALRQGGASRLQKEVDTLKTTEFEHACKMFGICRSAQGFRNELQDIISTFLTLPDDKLFQVNDAVTEILKDADLSAFTHSNPIQDQIKRAVKIQERTDAATIRSYLEVLFGVLSKSHQPLIVDKMNTFEKPAVQRTVSFHSFLDAIDDALPPTEANKKEWALIKSRLNRWKDGGTLDVQETLTALFNNVKSGVARFGEGSGKIRNLVRDIVKSVDED